MREFEISYPSFWLLSLIKDEISNSLILEVIRCHWSLQLKVPWGSQ
eukprot:gene15855-4789_t